LADFPGLTEQDVRTVCRCVGRGGFARSEPSASKRESRVKLKLDENLPSSAAVRLFALGFDVDTVLGERLGGQSDDSVWAAAQRATLPDRPGFQLLRRPSVRPGTNRVRRGRDVRAGRLPRAKPSAEPAQIDGASKNLQAEATARPENR
jgi:hypothetical protein